jgi:hypothetical protein
MSKQQNAIRRLERGRRMASTRHTIAVAKLLRQLG